MKPKKKEPTSRIQCGELFLMGKGKDPSSAANRWFDKSSEYFFGRPNTHTRPLHPYCAHPLSTHTRFVVGVRLPPVLIVSFCGDAKTGTQNLRF